MISFTFLCYVFFCFISILFGGIFFKDQTKSIFLFLFFGLVLPTSHQFSFVISYQGVYFYDYYFLLLASYYFIHIKIKDIKNIIKKNRLIVLLIIPLFSYYTYLILINSISFDKYLLRDFRPFLLLLYGLIFIELLKKIKIELKSVINILFYVLIFKLLFYVIVFLINPFEDPYYQAQLFRYRDGITFVAALFLIIFLFKKQDMLVKIPKFRMNIIVLLSILVLLISNLRILLPALLFIYFIVHKTTLNNLIKKLMISIIFISSFIGYTYLMPLIQYNLHTKAETVLVIKNLEEKKVKKHRIDTQKSKLNKGYTAKRYNLLFQNLNKQFNSRFSPALNHIKEMNFIEFIVGKGFATTFEIEYFKYRGLDTKNNSVDSAYLTFFVKYGLVGLALIVILFLRLILVNIKLKELKVSLIFFFLTVFLTASVLYHPGTILYLIFINLFMHSLLHEDTSHSLHLTS